MFLTSTFVSPTSSPAGHTEDVRVDPEGAILHIGGRHAKPSQDRPKLQAVGGGLLGRVEIRLAHDLHQRHARPVDVDQARRNPVRAGHVGELGGVLLEVDTGDADPLGRTADRDLDRPVHTQRQVVLRDLIPLHEVGIGVVLAIEFGVVRDLAVERKPGHDREVDGLAVDDRQHAGHAQADGTDVRVGRRAGVVGAGPAEHLASGAELHVRLQPNHDPVVGADVRCRQRSTAF